MLLSRSLALTAGAARRRAPAVAARLFSVSASRSSPATEYIAPSATRVPRPKDGRSRVVVLGSGWSSFALAKGLDPKLFDVVVVSPRNHMIFTPLLTSSSVGTLEFRSIVEPIKQSLPHVEYQNGKCRNVDLDRKSLLVRTEAVVPMGAEPRYDWIDVEYDVLCFGVGARNNTFNIPGVQENVHFLKELQDARAIRRDVIRNIEAANFEGTPEDERRRLLSFVIVGGGPTGVEFAGELYDFLTQDIRRLYPRIADKISVSLIEGRGLLSAFDQSLREYALRKLRVHNVKLLTGANVVRVNPKSLDLSDGSQVPYGLVVWSTGLAPRKIVERLDARQFLKDKWGHLVTDACLRVLRPNDASADGSSASKNPAFLPGVFAMGDCANVAGENYAATAQVAEQQGKYLAKRLNAAKARDPSLQSIPIDEPFEYKHSASLAYIGGFTGISDFRGAENPVMKPLAGATISGLAAWVIWRSAYLTKLGAWRNRIQVPADWFRTFFFGRDITYF